MTSPSSPSLASPLPRAFGTYRSFTLPTRLSDTRIPSTHSRSPGADIETLFESAKCKIVSFEPALPIERSRAASANSASPVPLPVGVLACGSKTERTIALGPLCVYRVPGSVAFLNSGKLVHAVLPKSSCWCVDGKTQFVLGVPGKKYYRIELPCENDDDQIKANEFKVVLAKICLYETTACPFKRGFYVELPDATAVTPKRPWRPKHEPGASSPWSPEGQQMVDGARVERRFPSPIRGLSQSPRRPYQHRAGSTAGSDTALVSFASTPENETPAQELSESKVPKLVAAFDEYGAATQGSGIPPSPLSQPSAIADVSCIENPLSDQEIPLVEVNELVSENVEALAIAQSVNASHIKAEEEPALAQDSDNELEDLAEPVSSEGSPTKQSSLPHLHLKGSAEGLYWLGGNAHDETPTTTRQHAGLRSVTAPTFSSLQPVKPSLAPVQPVQCSRHDSETDSLVSIESTASFHSLHSPTSPDSATDALGIITFSNSKSHQRDASSITVTISDDEVPADLSTPTWPTFSPIKSDEEEIDAGTESDTKSFMTAASPPAPSSPPSPESRQPRFTATSDSLRMRLQERRAQSPMPPPANIYVPSPTLSGHLRETILNKTASLLLGPPVQLVALMLNLARKFADGSLREDTYTYGDRGQPIPCDWLDSDIEGESSEEDDYGISIGGTPEKRRRKSIRSRSGQKVEID